jgi:hypothetical protein
MVTQRTAALAMAYDLGSHCQTEVQPPGSWPIPSETRNHRHKNPEAAIQPAPSAWHAPAQYRSDIAKGPKFKLKNQHKEIKGKQH